MVKKWPDSTLALSYQGHNMIMQVTMQQKQEEVRNACILKETLTRCHHTNILSMYT